MNTQKQIFQRPECPDCGSTNLRFRSDKTFQCRRCGYNNFDESTLH